MCSPLTSTAQREGKGRPAELSGQDSMARTDAQKASDEKLLGKKSAQDCSLPLFTGAGNSLFPPAKRVTPRRDP